MNCNKVLALSLLCSLPLLANAQTVRIVTDVSYPPFSKVNPDGSIVGFDPDIARAICTEAKLQCEVSTMDFDGIIPAVQAKKYDLAIASMNIARPSTSASRMSSSRTVRACTSTMRIPSTPRQRSPIPGMRR